MVQTLSFCNEVTHVTGVDVVHMTGRDFWCDIVFNLYFPLFSPFFKKGFLLSYQLEDH